MKTHKLLRIILFSNQKSGVSVVLRNLGPLVLLQNLKSTCGKKLKIQAKRTLTKTDTLLLF